MFDNIYSNSNTNTNFENELAKLKNKENFIKKSVTCLSFVAVIFATFELLIVTKIGLQIKPLIIFGIMLLLSVFGIMILHSEEKNVNKEIDDFFSKIEKFNIINTMRQFSNCADKSKLNQFVNMFQNQSQSQSQSRNHNNSNGFDNVKSNRKNYGYSNNSNNSNNSYKKETIKNETVKNETTKNENKPKRVYIKDTPFEKEFDVLQFKGCVPPEFVLKKRYKELVKQYHPDVCQGSDIDPYKIIGINEAYAKLEKFYKDNNIK